MGSFDYSHWRKPKWACFSCDTVYTRHHAKCPHCGNEQLKLMGTHFRAPKRREKKAWQAIKTLHDAGIRYQVHDAHHHFWTEMYDSYGKLFNRSDLWQVLAENGIGQKPENWRWNTDWQFPGKRPSHPRNVDKYIEEWNKKIIHRIALVYEICEKLEWQKPPVDPDILEKVNKVLEERAEKNYTATDHMDDESILIRLRKSKKQSS